MRPITLGLLIRALKSQPQDNWIFFTFGDLRPGEIRSWRGSYDELAVGWKYDNLRTKETVGEFVARLQKAVGKTYEGYKGGEFVMTEDTPVWAACWGRSHSCGIVGVVADGGFTYLETAFCTLKEVKL